jgi:NTP pyrophosphatase (non-canonical NTP hydrolase)
MLKNRIEEILESGLRYARIKAYLKRCQKKPEYPRDNNALFRLLFQEVQELQEEIMQPTPNDEYIARECGDIINFASMICEFSETPNG